MVEILKYNLVNKGTLVGKLNIKLPKWGNCIIKEICYFEKEGKKWISFPNFQCEVNGEKKYMPYISFEKSETMKSFQDVVLKALAEYLEKNNDQIL